MNEYMKMMLSLIEDLTPASMSDDPTVQGTATVIIAFLGVLTSPDKDEVLKMTKQVIQSAENVGLIQPGEISFSVQKQGTDSLASQLFSKVKRG